MRIFIISGRCPDITISGKNIDRHLFDHDYFFMKAKAIDFLSQMMRDSGQKGNFRKPIP
jgi:hypothetical protein